MSHPLIRIALLQARSIVDGLSDENFPVEDVLSKVKSLHAAIDVRSKINDPYDDDEDDALQLLFLSKSGDKALQEFHEKIKMRSKKQLLLTDEYVKCKNFQMRELLKDYERGLEIMMKKYRNIVTEEIIESKQNFNVMQNAALLNLSFEQKQQIAKLKELMREAANCDDIAINQQDEALAYLEYENKILSELHKVAMQYGSIQQSIKFSDLDLHDKATQTKVSNESVEDSDDDETPRNQKKGYKESQNFNISEDIWKSEADGCAEIDLNSIDPVDFEEPPEHDITTHDITFYDDDSSSDSSSSSVVSITDSSDSNSDSSDSNSDSSADSQGENCNDKMMKAI